MSALLQSLASLEMPPPRPAKPDAESRFNAVDLRDMVLDRIQQGLCVFDGEQRLLLFNRRYAEMYDIDPSKLWIGMTLRDVVDLRYAAGSGPNMSPAEYASWRDRIGVASQTTDTEVTLRSGAVHAIHHEPTAYGGWVATFDDITERRRAERRVRHMAHYDALTDLPNRVLFAERLEQTVPWFSGQGRLEDHRSPPGAEDCLMAVLFIDLDHFKDVNDTLGHAAGDELLRQVARRIQACLREEDTFARLGGDEFAIMLHKTVASEAQVVEIARRVIEVVSKPYLLDTYEAVVSASVGIALCARHDREIDPAVLLRQADTALYRSKAQERGTYCLFQAGMGAALTRRKDMERDLRRALAEGSLDLHFQPLMTLAPRRIVGAEALARWNHPTYGMVPPSEFIPLAEEAGLIVELGRWVLHTACARATKWDGLTIAINLSPDQVRQASLVEQVEAALAESGLPPNRLELEITEGILLRDTSATMAKLTRLRDLGIGIALDDFGTGYSSLSYLRRFPFSKLKVDRSFTAMITDSGTAAIVQAITSLGRSLDMRVLVEGIETEAQLEMLRTIGCNEGQGYLLGRPCPAQDFERMLTNQCGS